MARTNQRRNNFAWQASEEAIVDGLRDAGSEWTDAAIAGMRHAMAHDHYVTTDEDARLFAASLVCYGDRDQVDNMMDDHIDSEVTAITGCETGEELVEKYIGKPVVDTSDLYEIYYGHSDDTHEDSKCIFVRYVR